MTSAKNALPTSTAEAPASSIAAQSEAFETPPQPTTGIFTAPQTCQTARSASGNTAGPESPATTRSKAGFPVLISIAMPSHVFAQTMASAPSASTARATAAMSAACGVSFTQRRPFHAPRAARTASAACPAHIPHAMPSPSAFGHDMLSSAAAIPSTPDKTFSVSRVSAGRSMTTLATTGAGSF